MNHFFLRFYEKLVLEKPLLSLSLVALAMVLLGSQAHQFKLDASGDSLVLENDKDLRYFRKINKIYGSKDFLIITYSSPEDLLSDNNLRRVPGGCLQSRGRWDRAVQEQPPRLDPGAA